MSVGDLHLPASSYPRGDLVGPYLVINIQQRLRVGSNLALVWALGSQVDVGMPVELGTPISDQLGLGEEGCGLHPL